MTTNETVIMSFRTSRDIRFNLRFRHPRPNVTRTTLSTPIELLTNGTQYFDDRIGLLVDFIEATRETVLDETLYQKNA